MCKSADGLVCVVLGLGDARPFKVEDLDRFGLTTFRCVDDLKASRAGDDAVLSPILITERMTTNDDWLLPPRYKTGNARDNNGFTENSPPSGKSSVTFFRGKIQNVQSLQNVPDGTVGR